MNLKMRYLLLVFGVTLLVFPPLTASAEEVKSGVIKGQVNYCAQGGYIGMQVFIPGRQFMAFLGQDGNFIFEGVPVGAFNLNYLINSKLVHETNNVIVTAGETTDLGKIAFCDTGGTEQATTGTSAPAAEVLSKCEESPDLAECQDADKDGVIAGKDCNDNDASIMPGADELCDGIDNNCNGKIDEALKVKIPNGIGLCNNSVVSVDSCSKGFSDCDKDPANGCETDIFNDPENCGACGNECSDLEICRLGWC